MESSNLIHKQIQNWQDIQSLTFDVLQSLSDEQLKFTVGKNMGTLGEQFRHIIRIRFQYTEAIESGKVSDLRESIDLKSSESKESLLTLWEKSKQQLLNAVKKASPDASIDWSYWGDDNLSLVDHLQALMDHETLHNGELIVYLKSMEYTFPKSWAVWGL